MTDRQQGAPRPCDPAAHGQAFAGLQILIIEDEQPITMLLSNMLEEFGCEIAGTAATINEALGLISGISRIDAAILDVNLGGEKIFPVADVLLKRAVPFVFSTGYGPADLAQRYPGSPLLHKPYRADALAEALLPFARARRPQR